MAESGFVHRATYGPNGWEPVASSANGSGTRAWVKVLRRPERGDSFALLRLDAGAAFDLAARPADRALVIEGAMDLLPGSAGGTPRQYRKGAFVAPLEGMTEPPSLSSPGSCLVLLIGGAGLGESAEDVFSPADWFEAGPGVWSRLLLKEALGPEFEERIVGLAYIEPGGSVPLHDHRTAHLFLFLDGEADDEIVHGDGRRETAVRRRGDFVEYPHPASHRTFSRTGCMILFIHEPVSAQNG